MEYFSVMPLFDKNCILYGHYSILASTILEYDIKPMVLLVAYKYIIKTFTYIAMFLYLDIGELSRTNHVQILFGSVVSSTSFVVVYTRS